MLLQPFEEIVALPLTKPDAQAEPSMDILYNCGHANHGKVLCSRNLGVVGV